MTFALLSLWTFFLIGRPQDLIAGLEALRPAMILAALTFLGVAFQFSQNHLDHSGLRTPEARRYFIFFGIVIIGIPFAYHRGEAFKFIFSAYLINVMFFVALVTLVDSVEKLKRILSVILFCTAFYGVFGLLMGTFSGGRFTIYGGMFDANDTAYLLLTLSPLSLFFLIRREGKLKKIVASVAIGASVIIILLTGSRGGLLGLGVVFLLSSFSSTISVRTPYKIGFLIMIVTIAALNLDMINVDRYLTLTDIGQDYNLTSETGRLGIWTQGFQLLLANPLTGVGVQCFPMAIGYLRADANSIPEWQATHNSFLQVAVETGFVGFLIFLSLISISIRNFSRCRSFKPVGSIDNNLDELMVVAGLLQLAFIGHLVAAFFLSQGYSLFFALFFALSAVLRRLTNASDEAKDHPVHPVFKPYKVSTEYGQAYRRKASAA